MEGAEEWHEDGGKERQKEDSKERRDGGEKGKEFRRQEDGQDKGGNEVLRRQDEGANKEQNEDKKQVERQGTVNMRQDGDGGDWATEIWKNDEGEKRGKMEKRRTTSEFGRFLQAVQAGSRRATARRELGTVARRQRRELGTLARRQRRELGE